MTVTGFQIHIDGVMRTFRDKREVAYEAARMAKTKSPRSKVEIVCESTDKRIEMLEDGRTS